MGGNNESDTYMEQNGASKQILFISESHTIYPPSKQQDPTHNRQSSMRATHRTCQYLSQGVSRDPYGAEEQAQGDGMSGLNVVLDAIMVDLPASSTVKYMNIKTFFFLRAMGTLICVQVRVKKNG
jgi:hypothetical protein